MSVVREFIDATLQVPFMVWVLIITVGVLTWLAFLAATAEVTTPEQRDRIVEAHRELRGARGMPKSTRSTAPAPTSGTSHHSSRGEAGPARRHALGTRRPGPGRTS